MYDSETISKKKKYSDTWKEWKRTHADRVIACPECDKSLSYQNILSSLKFRCPRCKHECNPPKIRLFDKNHGRSGKRKRDWTKLVDESGNVYKPLDNNTVLDILNSNLPDPSLVYQPVKYTRFLRQNALIAMIYLLGARVSELCGIKQDKEYKDIFPLKRNQIHFELKDGKKVIVVENINILKRKEGMAYDVQGQEHKVIPKRTIKLWYDLDGEIFKHVEKYIEMMDRLKLKDGVEDYELFPISRQSAINYLVRIYEKYLSKKGVPEDKVKSKTAYLHWLRHSRLTYLSIKFKMTDAMLRHYVGWSSSQMAQKYVHLQPDDLLNKMQEE